MGERAGSPRCPATCPESDSPYDDLLNSADSMHFPAGRFRGTTQSGGKETEQIDNWKYQDLRIRFQNLFSYVQITETRAWGGGSSPPFFKIFLEIDFSQMLLRPHARIGSSLLTSQP